jgi:hypothetical protein
MRRSTASGWSIASKVVKYVGSEGVHVSTRWGWGQCWPSRRGGIEELARDLLKIYARREMAEGFRYSPPDRLFREFEAAFPYEETPDQLSAIGDVLADMESERPMDRLICGDVGYGKTEVAIRAAFKAALDGRQVAVLVPTTVLARQHGETFAERFKGTPVEVEMVSRFRSAAGNAFRADGGGKIDVLIGTHRVFRAMAPKISPAVRRGAALRRHPQGAPEGAAHAGRRVDADRDADPAHAADGDGRAARDLDHRDAARRPAGDPHLRHPLRRGSSAKRPA